MPTRSLSLRPDQLLAHDGTYGSQQHPDILPYNLNYQRYCFVDLSGLNTKNLKDVPFGSTWVMSTNGSINLDAASSEDGKSCGDDVDLTAEQWGVQG